MYLASKAHLTLHALSSHAHDPSAVTRGNSRSIKLQSPSLNNGSALETCQHQPHSGCASSLCRSKIESLLESEVLHIVRGHGRREGDVDGIGYLGRCERLLAELVPKREQRTAFRCRLVRVRGVRH